MNLEEKLILVGQNKKVLIVDDSAFTRKVFEKSFSQFFEELVIVEDGQKGLDLYKERRDFDLIITDIYMPIMDGLVLSTKIREINPDQAIIVISSTDDIRYLMPLIELGIDAFVLKPIDHKIIMQRVIKMLENINYQKIVDSIKNNEIKVSCKECPNKSVEVTLDKENIELLKPTKPKCEYNISSFSDNTKEQLSAKEFLNRLKNNKTQWMETQTSIKLLLKNLSNLKNERYKILSLAQEDDIDIFTDTDIKVILERMSISFIEIHSILGNFDELYNLSRTFFKFKTLFDDFLEKEEIKHHEIESLSNMGFVIDDCQNFIENIFITKSANNIYIFEQILQNDLEHLKFSLKETKAKENTTDLEFL
jgi:CheY-like chemotaxis protein